MKLVRVYETLDPLRGLLVRGLLESDGIQVLATGEGSGPYRMGPVILSVVERDADRARELVEAADAGRLTLWDDETPDVERLVD
jgi:hypothetical protein